MRVYLGLNLGFTFQYGEIKSFDAMAAARVQMEFTFQYGEIKSFKDASITSSLIPYLHSSMERLKACGTLVRTICGM